MAKLSYSAIMSLDGYIADVDGNFDWAEPDEDVHTLVNDLERPIGTYLYGRRMYEVMVAWETIDDELPFIKDYAKIWRAADKVVYSRSLETVSSARTRIERSFDPDAIRTMKETEERDISVGGAELAAQAIRAGLVDVIQLFVAPIVVGGGTRALPDDVRVKLELLDERRSGNGTVYLRYRSVLEGAGAFDVRP
ncbi:MAG TPA: dihydrofolate reductase family protein [Actinomycetota bacterium]|nr:dihydrofolate reductase family protein [Actinomycetota bacterium]